MSDWTPATHQTDDDRPRLRLTRIDVQRAPGISPGFTIDAISPDITIVFGPNASGKSTTARAIQSILWPSPAQLRGHQLAADFELDGDHWHVEADAGTITRTCNGEAAAAPLMAPIDDRNRYTLGLPDLLASENQPLAQAILTESSGGFDLSQAAHSLGFSDTIPPRLEEARQSQQAAAAAHAAEAAERETLNQLGRRESLLAGRSAALNAERDITAIQSALILRERERAEQEQRDLVGGFAANVRRANSDEPARLAELANEIGKAQAQLSEADRLRENWQRMIDEASLTHIDDPETFRAGLAAAGERRNELATAITAAERELATASAERKAHQRRLATDIDDEQIAALDADGMREVADIAAAFEDIRARRTARDELEIWLGGIKPPDNLDALQTGVETLQSRLQHPNAAEYRSLTGKVQLAAAAGGALTLIGGAALGIIVNPLWWILAAVGVLLMILAWRLAISDSPKIAAELENQYASLPLPQPESWTRSAVSDLLGTLREELNVALVEQEKADRWAELDQERQELDRAYAETEERRTAAVRKFGTAPDLKEESLRLLAENLGRWQAADAVVRGIQGRIDKLKQDDASVEQKMRDSLALVGLGEGDIDQHLHDLDRRIASAAAARIEHDQLQTRINTNLQPEVDRLVEQRDAIFTDLDLDAGDTDGLRSLLEQRTSLLRAEQELATRELSTREAWEATAANWREQSEEDLLAALDQARAVAETRNDIELELRGLAEIQQAAHRSQRREQANADLANARAELARARDEIAERVIGDTLANGIQRETRDAALPIVFHRARQLFGIITRGKYELQFEVGPPPEFTALDTGSGVTLNLEQLSSGTRVQLLMAIRLAFVENVEIGPRLPVLLDETLGNSDELRASAIIDAAIDICRNGRQVFYFTAQGDEVARWLHRVEQMPEEDRPSISVVELAELRKDAGFERLPIPQTTPHERRPIPSPADYDSATWAAALRVPAIDPWAESTGGTHLWHLCKNREVLHTLLEQDVTTLGQLESIARTNPEQLHRIHPDIAHEMATIEARTALLNGTIAMWRIGKARPMPAGVLADADMIDAVALDEMHALQREAHNDGQSLIERLQTMDDPPLAEKPLEALELWLISEGYIAQGAPMSDKDMRARLIEIASPHIREHLLEPDDVDQMLEMAALW